MGAFGLEKEDDAHRSLAGGFVELSNMENNDSRRFSNSVRKLEPVVVTTVNSEESGDAKNKVEDTHNNLELTFDVFPKSTKASIQLGMTLLFVLLLPAAFLTVTSNPEYAFIICVFWFILVSLFLGLIWVVRAVVLKDSRAQAFHPLVHAIAERFAQEIKDFHSDFRQEFLSITDGPAVDEEVNYTESSRDQSLSHQSRQSPARQPRKSKSAVFRAVVQPFLPLVRRRKGRRKKALKEGGTSYEPPISLV